MVKWQQWMHLEFKWWGIQGKSRNQDKICERAAISDLSERLINGEMTRDDVLSETYIITFRQVQWLMCLMVVLFKTMIA